MSPDLTERLVSKANIDETGLRHRSHGKRFPGQWTSPVICLVVRNGPQNYGYHQTNLNLRSRLKVSKRTLIPEEVDFP